MGDRLDYFQARVAECSLRLAQTGRERNDLREELSKARRQKEARNVGRDQQLQKVGAERDALRQQLQASRKSWRSKSKECDRLRGRLQEALAWCSSDEARNCG